MKETSKQLKCKRNASRQPTEAFVTCHPYTSSGNQHATDGVMRNFSSDGFYIETSRPYISGTILFMRMVRYPQMHPTVTEDHPRSICLVEVKWLQTLAHEDAIRYGMGVRYLE